MCSKSSLKKTLSLLVILGIASACSTNDDQEAEQRAAEMMQSRQIELAEVSNGECLDLQKYFDALRGMPDGTRSRKITTDFKVKNLKSALPRNFYLSLAAGAFMVEDGDLAQLPDLMVVKQVGCETVVFSAEGHSDVYKIKEAEKDSITFENEWDGGMKIRWKGPLSMEMSTMSVVTQDLCNSSSKVRKTIVQQISWGDDSVHAATLGEKEIEPSFLSLVSEVKGFAFNSLYSDMTPPAFSPVPIPPGPEQPVTDPESPDDIGPGFFDLDEEVQPVAPSDERKLVISRLKELQASPLRPGLDQCF